MHKRKQWEKHRRADLGLKQSESSQEFPLLKSEEYTSAMVQPAITVPGTQSVLKRCYSRSASQNIVG